MTESVYITEVPLKDRAISQNNADSSEEEFNDSDEEVKESNQHFQVDQAEPPTNYDDAFSTMPKKVEQKLSNIKVTYKQLLIFIERHCFKRWL